MIEDQVSISSTPTRPAPAKKKTMSAASRKRLSELSKKRWADRKAASQNTPAPPPTPAAAPPSAAVLSLQSQVVELVGKRTEARERLTSQHAQYLIAQAHFQSAEDALKGIEQEVQYRINLIAQLENRAPVISFEHAANNITQFPSLSGVSSEPAPAQPLNTGDRAAHASANDLRAEMMRKML